MTNEKQKVFVKHKCPYCGAEWEAEMIVDEYKLYYTSDSYIFCAACGNEGKVEYDG